ncbi:MAG: tetratricopeptide repeat protein [Candidatus Sumerlaeota bacterium]|nr:tetratricopeptide repeat protein [Candidatus Sumerlaeota bacterium]
MKSLFPMAAIAICAGIVFFLFSDPFLAPPDCASYWAWAQSLAGGLNFSFGDAYESLQMPAFYVYLTPAGRLSNDWPMGAGLALLPTAAFGRIISHAWMMLWVTAAMLIWARRNGRFGVPARSFAVICTLLGTPLLFYTLFGPFFSHAVSFAVSSLFLIAWDRTRAGRTRAEWFLLGLLLGFAGLIRPQNILLGLVFFAQLSSLMTSLKTNGARRIQISWRPRWMIFAAGVLLGFAPQLIAYWGIYGSPVAFPKVSEMHWLHPALRLMLFSDFHGVLPWTPIYVLGCAGLVMLWKHDSVLACGLLLALAGQIYLNAANMVWWSGGSFGNRRLADSAIVTAYGLAALWGARPNRFWKASMGTLGAVCCFWTLWLMLAERRLLAPLDHYVPFSGREFRAGMPLVWTQFGATINALLRPLRDCESLGMRIGASLAVVAGCAVLFVLVPGITRRISARLAVPGVIVASFLILITLAAALRTPALDHPDLPQKLGRSSGILWDNYIELAFYEIDTGGYERAEQSARNAVGMRPDHYSGWWYLGLAQYYQAKWLDAAASFGKVRELNPSHARAAEFCDLALSRAGLSGNTGRLR